MTAVPFDTLKLAKGLEAGGFSAEQASAAVSALAEAANVADFASKSDLSAGLRDMEQRLTIKLGGVLVVAVGVLLAAIRYLPGH